MHKKLDIVYATVAKLLFKICQNLYSQYIHILKPSAYQNALYISKCINLHLQSRNWLPAN